MRPMIITLLLLSLSLVHCRQRAEHDAALSPQEKLDKDMRLRNGLAKPSSITFRDVKELIFEPHCLSCHDNGNAEDNINLSEYRYLVEEDGEFRKVMRPFDPGESSLYTSLKADGGLRMPKDALPLQPQEIEYVKAWIVSGAKENGDPTSPGEPPSSPGDPGEPPAPPVSLKDELRPYFENPETIDYPVVNRYVFEFACNKCHSANGSASDEDAMLWGANFTDYASIFGFPESIKKGHPSESPTFESVIGLVRQMPPESEGYDLLNPYRTKLLRLWILNCAIEDYGAMEGEELSRGNFGKRRKCEGDE